MSALPLVSVRPTLARLLPWCLRIAAVVLLASLPAPAPPRATPGPDQIVETQHPQMCVHTRLIDEVDEWKIQRSLQMVREMGAPNIVEFFPWAYIESTEGRYDWGQADRIVRHARNQGVRIIARLGLVPGWAQQGADGRMTLNTLPETRYAEFARFAAAFAQRYAGVIDQIIIWNEPNLAFEWGYREVSPAAYARLLQAVYPRIHAANPQAQVLAAPLAPTLEPAGSPAAMNDLDYLRALYAAGAAPYFDALAMHPYGFTQPAMQPPSSDRLNFRRAELQRAIMVEHGDAHKPVYITEMGWNSSERWVYAVTPAQRAAYTLDALVLADRWPWLRSACIWVFRFPAPTFSYPDGFTLVDTEFQPQPLYLALQAHALGAPQEARPWLPAPASR